MTPQWFQNFKFYITDINEPLMVKLWDENDLIKNSPLSEATIDLSKNYKLNYIYDSWYNMIPLGSYKIGGKVRLEIQITENHQSHCQFQKIKCYLI